jgi:hypothetical protein
VGRSLSLVVALATLMLVTTFAGPASAADNNQEAATADTLVTVAGYPPNPNFVDIAFPSPDANKIAFWQLWLGKGYVCNKQAVSGNFTTVSPFDAVVGKYSDPEVTIRLWQPAPPMYGTPGSTVWRMTCNDTTPPPPEAVLNPYAQFSGPCEGNKYWVELNNTQSTRPDKMTARYVDKFGNPAKIPVVVPPLQIWRSSLFRVDLNSGQDMWVYDNSSGQLLVRRPALPKDNSACPDYTVGFSWN